MLLRDALKKLKYDRRLQEYNIDKGILTKEELQTEISGLEDIAHRSESLRFKEERRPKAEEPQQASNSQFGGSSDQGGGGYNNY